MAQSVEHILGKDEVIGSIPISSSILKNRPMGGFLIATARSAIGTAFFFLFAIIILYFIKYCDIMYPVELCKRKEYIENGTA